MKLCIIAGARPNFMKIAPVIEEIEKHNKVSQKLPFLIKYEKIEFISKNFNL
jgi:hypothetical protein